MFALHTGASGLTTYGEAMTVTGSNIANVNTLGYKGNRVNFHDMVATGIRGTDAKVGKGVMIGSVQADFSQGNMQGTTQTTDMALDGDGFFTVKDPAGRTFYTRAGNFRYDDKGYLATTEGQQVLGWQVDPATGENLGFAKPMQLVGFSDPPKATGDGMNGTGVTLAANLDADATIRETEFDPTNVQSDMYNFSSTVNVVDANGSEHTMNVVFRRLKDQPAQIDPATGQAIPGTAHTNRWAWYVVTNAGEFGGTPGVNIALGGGFADFTSNGRLLKVTNGRFVQPPPPAGTPAGQPVLPQPPVLVESPVDPNIGMPQVTLPYGENPMIVGINFGKGSNPMDPMDARTGLDGLTSFSSESKILKLESDGRKAGILEDIEVGKDGTVQGHFDNGQVRSLYRLQLTRFVNPGDLLRKGENMFEESITSGKPLQGSGGKGGFGNVRTRNLERSNIDLAHEFVKMIETQRAFQSNAKSITTSDEMLQDLVSMKR
ncbi:MAG: flagellar hook protein FlgE [Deltaproteobacteria bacterium]|nr:flagellar hook protein FlgE [Deltaproteobacteria bacterium]